MRWRNHLVIIILGLAAYSPSLRVGFIWDDHFTVEEKPSIRSWSWANVAHDFTTGLFDDPKGVDFYRPLEIFVNRINYSICGLRPFGFHVFNLLFHILNALLLAALTGALGFSSLAALFVGSLFVVHPAIVQDLIVISGRDELMSLGFTLAALIILLKPGRTPLFIGTVLYGLAMLSKESAVILPGLLALLLWYRGDSAASLRRPIFLMGPLFVYLLWHRHVMHHIVPSIPIELGLAFFTKAFPQMLLHYVRLAVWPWNLYTDRMIGLPGHYWPLYLGAFLLLIGWLAWKKNRLAWLCSLWFLLPLLPKTILTIQASLIHDHWIYPMLWAILLPMGILLAEGWASPKLALRYVARTSFFAVLIFWSFLVHLNIELRGTDEKLYRWAMNFRTSSVMKNNLAALLWKEGRYAEAIPYLEILVAESPNDQKLLATLEYARKHAGAFPINLSEKFHQRALGVDDADHQN